MLMVDSVIRLFEKSLDVHGPLVFQVRPVHRSRTRRIELDQPFAVIGSGREADVQLGGDDVSFRHVYVQAMQGRVYFVDLGSKSGTRLGDSRTAGGWFSRFEPLRIGRHIIELAGSEDEPHSSVPPACPLESVPERLDELPCFQLQVTAPDGSQSTIIIDRLMTLVGRGKNCQVVLPDDSVSRVHCCLLLTPAGLWVVDLLGKTGVAVNGTPARCTLFEHGDLLKVGAFSIAAQLLDSTEDLFDSNSGFRLEPPAIESATEMVSNVEAATEPVVVHDAGVVDNDPEPPAPVELDPTAAAAHAASFEWLGKLFEVEREGPTLIVKPSIHIGTFRFSQLHIETNALRRKLDDRTIHYLVMDFQGMNYVGSEAIGAIIQIARRATDCNAHVAFCGISRQVKEVLMNMRLFDLWPNYPSRDEALQRVRERHDTVKRI